MQIGKHTYIAAGSGFRFIVKVIQGSSLQDALKEVSDAITAFYEYYNQNRKPEAVMVFNGEKFPKLRLLEVKPDRIIYAVGD